MNTCTWRSNQVLLCDFVHACGLVMEYPRRRHSCDKCQMLNFKDLPSYVAVLLARGRTEEKSKQKDSGDQPRMELCSPESFLFLRPSPSETEGLPVCLDRHIIYPQ